jgi:dihydropyrimidinase
VRAEALHESDYTPWEGRAVDAWPCMTVLRGEVVVEDERWVGRDARGGQWLPRAVPEEIRAGAAL